jgi:hypothetical protein
MLNELLPDFSKELQSFCALHCANRNAELHTGEERFSGIKAADWLPKYYATCDVLLKSLGKSLNDLFHDPKTAQEMILALYFVRCVLRLRTNSRGCRVRLRFPV